MNARRWRATALFALAVLAAALIATRARYTADLSAFLPRSPSSGERALVEQLRSGPAARLIIVAIAGADAGTRAALSRRLAAALAASGDFASISNGDAAQLERDRQFLFRHRYLLSETVDAARFSATGLHTAIADSLDALASPEGPLLKGLFPADPTGEFLGILEELGPERAPHLSAGVWSSRDDSEALLLLQTRAPGADSDAQQRAVLAVRQAFLAVRAQLPAARGTTLQLSGPPVFALAARTLIKGEVLRLSGVSTALIVLLLLLVYRSLPALLLGLIPVASGALAGIAAVAAGFGTVHGITLGFGVTLIGEAVDYSIYLFVQARGEEHGPWRQTVWPTIRLGVLTSIAGFAALVPSSFQGLAQLGLYSVAGLSAAALVTRYVLPQWLPQRLALRDLTRVGVAAQSVLGRLRRLRALLLAVPLAAAFVLLLHRGHLLGHELAALSPVPLADQQLDERLRAQLGAPDVRFMVLATAATPELALAAADELTRRLAGLVRAGVIAGVESPSRYLPPQALQRARQQALPPAAELQARLGEALAGLPVEAAVLEPFVRDVAAAQAAPLLSRADLSGTSFASVVDALLVPADGGYSALLPLSGGGGDLPPQAVAQVRTALAAAQVPGALLLDLKGETDRLYQRYLQQAIALSLSGFAAIVVLLALLLRSAQRVVRVLAPLVLAVLAVATLLVGLGHELTILHLIGMLLIVAVGSNYALFFDRAGNAPQQGSLPLTLASLLVANLATVLAFGVLGSSRLPMLSDLGSTVAPGALLALVFAALLAPGAAARGA